MNQKQRKRHKQAVKQIQEDNRQRNKSYPEDAGHRRDKDRATVLGRFNLRGKIRARRIKKKKIQRLKALRDRRQITGKQYQREIKKLEKQGES